MARILMIGGYLPGDPRTGGGQLIGCRLAQALARQGHQVEYSALPASDGSHGVLPHGVRFRSGDLLQEILEPLRDKEGDYGLVHIHEGDETWAASLGYGLFRKKGRLVVGFYAPEAHRIPRSLPEVARRFLVRRADLVFALSQYSRKNIATAYGVSPSKIEVMYGGADPAFFSSGAPPAGPVPTLLFVGRLDGPGRQKGLDTLLEALPLVLASHPVRLHVVGAGPGEGPFREQAARLHVGDHVTFHGFVNQDGLPPYYRNADLVVLPSRRESFGLVLAEAMAAGRPVVASRVGAIPEVVKDGVTGLLIPPDDPKACADAIVSLLNSPDRMRETGRKGQERARACFTWEKVAERVSAAYNRLLEESH
jgi:glycosyltransferase involved in cell wall biosynthesis